MVTLGKKNDHKKSKNENNDLKAQLKVAQNQKEALTSQIKNVNTLDLRGPPGLRGEPGMPGGTFSRQGVLRNVSKPNLVSDRMFGSGLQSIAYLSDQNYKAHQHWTLDSNSLLENQFGGCLEANPTTKDVHMSRCDQSSKEQKWNHDKNGRLVLKNTNECLAVAYYGQIKSMPAIVNNRGKGSRVHNDINKLKLETCDNQNFPTNQQWAFY